jgi:hypothetical protein
MGVNINENQVHIYRSLKFQGLPHFGKKKT